MAGLRIQSPRHSDAMTTYLGAARGLWRSVMTENRCTQTRCADTKGENCLCRSDFNFLVSSAFALPEVVLEEDDAQGIEAEGADAKTGCVRKDESPVGVADAPYPSKAATGASDPEPAQHPQTKVADLGTGSET